MNFKEELTKIMTQEIMRKEIPHYSKVIQQIVDLHNDFVNGISDYYENKAIEEIEHQEEMNTKEWNERCKNAKQ